MAEVRDLQDVIDSDAARQQSLEKLDRALHGDFAPPYLPAKGRGVLEREYDELIERSELPILGMLVSAQVDRLKVTGIRTDDSHTNDAEVWDWWQDSQLDRGQVMIYRDSAGYGDGFALAVPEGGRPRFYVESPLCLHVEFDPLEPVRVKRAVKIVGNRAWLYDDEAIWQFRRGDTISGWEAAGKIEHAAGECPVVRFPNNLDSKGRSYSEVGPVLSTAQRIQQTLFDRLLIQRHQSWRQRWAVGITMERDEEGRPKAPFETGADTMLINEAPDGKFGEFSQASLDPLLKAIDSDLAAAAMITRTPPQFLPQASISSVSSEALVALESAFVSKIAEKQQLLGEQHERLIRIGGKMVGYTIPEDTEVVWADLELRSLAQRSDAALKLRSIGMPMRAVLEIMGYSSQSIERILAEMDRERLTDARAQAAAFGVQGDYVDRSLVDPYVKPSE